MEEKRKKTKVSGYPEKMRHFVFTPCPSVETGGHRTSTVEPAPVFFVPWLSQAEGLRNSEGKHIPEEKRLTVVAKSCPVAPRVSACFRGCSEWIKKLSHPASHNLQRRTLLSAHRRCSALGPSTSFLPTSPVSVLAHSRESVLERLG